MTHESTQRHRRLGTTMAVLAFVAASCSSTASEDAVEATTVSPSSTAATESSSSAPAATEVTSEAAAPGESGGFLVDLPVVDLSTGDTISLASLPTATPTLLWFWAPH